MAISTTFTLKFAGAAVERGLERVKSGFKSLGGVAAKAGKMLLSPFAAFTALLGSGALIAGMASFIKSSSAAASSVESLTTQFTTLLGSATAAQDRMKEITKFAASTPFEIQELAATSKLLEVMGGKLISTGDGLRLVGDAAAMAGQPIGEVGLHIGRLFSAITFGTSAGESVNRLQELGLITGETKIKFEELAAAQKKGTAATLTGEKALKLLQGVMSKSRGGMEALSKTTEGKLSNVRDNIDQLKVAFGTGFNDGLKIALDAVNTKLPQLMAKFTQFGSLIGKTIQDAVNGDLTRFFMIGNMIGDAIMEGVKLITKKGFLELGTSINRFLLTGFEHTEEDVANMKKQDKADIRNVLESDMSDFIQNMKSRYAEALSLPSSVPTVEPPQRLTEDGRIWTPKGVPANELNQPTLKEILQSIDRKLSPQP